MGDIVEMYDGYDLLDEEIDFLENLTDPSDREEDRIDQLELLSDALRTCPTVDEAKHLTGEHNNEEFLDRLKYRITQDAKAYMEMWYSDSMTAKEKYKLWFHSYNLRHKNKIKSLYI